MRSLTGLIGSNQGGQKGKVSLSHMQMICKLRQHVLLSSHEDELAVEDLEASVQALWGSVGP